MNVMKYLPMAVFSVAALGFGALPVRAQYNSYGGYSCPYTYYLDDGVICTDSADAYSSLMNGGSSGYPPSSSSSSSGSGCFQQYNNCIDSNTSDSVYRDLDCAVTLISCVKDEVWN